MQMRDGKELKPCLSGRGVTKVFGFGDAKTVAVDHVDFDFHEGEFVSIVGESGSGKTTLSIKYFPGIQFNRSYECSILKGYPILFNCKRRRHLADRREKCNIC